MAEETVTAASPFYGYPEAKKTSTPFSHTPGSNPVVRGIPLAIAGSVVAKINLLSGFLWGNAGFSSLRKLKELDGIAARYDPTVIPVLEKPAKEVTLNDNSNAAQSVDRRNLSHHYSVVDYHIAYKEGTLTPTTVAKTILDLLLTPRHRLAFLDIRPSNVLAAAEESTRRYRDGQALSTFDGVPVAVKDEVDVDGYEKSLGSCKDFTPQHAVTSWCVKKWEEAGAVVIGKLAMHELGLDTTNNNPTKGTPLNPHNSHYYTGGSSGGSAYAVSAGLVPVTLGADGGGSIRIPSAYCGLYGLKPSHGRISGSPTPSLASSNSVLGPMASNMADLELTYRIMAAPDPDNASSSLFPAPVPRPGLHTHSKLLGIYKPWFDCADASVLKDCHEAVSYYESAGYTLMDITLPYLAEGQIAHALTILTEISTGIHDLTGLTPANKILLSVGKQTPAFDFLLAQKLRNVLMQHLAFLFRRHPGLLIVTPTTPNAGWHISGGLADLKHGVSDANMSVRSMEYVWLANFTGCPALSIPVGKVKAKEGEGTIPVGLMAMGEWGSEDALIGWGKIGEKWASEGDGRIGKAESWVDVMALTKTMGERVTR